MTARIVKVILRGDVAGFTASMAAAKTSVVSTASAITASTKVTKDMTEADREAAKALDARRAGLTTLGSAAGKVGLVAAAGLGLATKAAMDWETAWAGVTKTVDGSASELAELEVGLRDLAKTLPATHEEIAGVAEAAGQLGVATADIESFTKTMIDLGETTNLTAEEAATSIAQMANVMGTSGDEIDNLGSALVAVGNAGASTERQIIQMSQGIAGAANVVGLTEAEVLGISNAIASIGIEVEAGGTSISRVLVDMGKATAQGGADLDRFAAAAGMSAEDFAASFRDTPAEAFTSFIEGLGNIKDAGGDLFTTLDELGLSDVRVSKALLGMAADSEKFAGSLDLSSKAWEENTALTDEAGKRYGTTASKAQVAINGIRDDMIELGETALPIVAEVSEAVSNVTGVFGGLPDPIKKVTGALLAVTAVTGGALWFGSKVINSVTSTRKALDDIGTSSGKTATKLGKMGRTAGGILAVGTAVGILADDIGRIESSNLDRLLTALALTGDAGKDLKTVIDDIGTVTSKWNAIDLGEVVTLGGLFGDTSLDRAADNIDQVDQRLAALVETGERAQAAQIFKGLQELASEQGVDPSKLTDQFDAYALALENAAAEGKNAGEESGRTAEEIRNLANQSGVAATQITKMSDAEVEAAQAAREVGQEFVGLGEHIDNADVSLKDWIRSLENQAKALVDFKDNAIQAGKKGLSEGLIAELEAAGPAGALRMRQLADGTKEEIAKANIAWRKGQNAIADYVAMVVPPKDIEVNTDPAKTELNALTGLLNTMLGGITIPVRVAREGSGGAVGPGQADGGTIAGARHPYGDKVLTPTAPGEFVMSNRYGQADKNRAALEAGNRGAILRVAGGMADGGTVGGYADGGSVRGTGYEAGAGITVYFPTPIQLHKAAAAANTIAGAAAAAAGSSQRTAEYTKTIARSAADIRKQNLDDLNTQRRIRDLRRDLAARDDKGRLELRGLDRTIARAELADARAELVAIRNQVRAAKAEAQRDRERARKEARDEAIRALRERRADTKSTLTGSADIFGRGVRPAGAIAEVNRQIADIAEYGTVIARLKGAGASPALLAQVVAKAESGDFRSAIRLGQALLANPMDLAGLNSALHTLGAVSASVAGVTTDPRFMSAAAWNPGSTVTKVVQVTLGADPSAWLLQTQRIVQHEVSAQLAAAGV